MFDRKKTDAEIQVSESLKAIPANMSCGVLPPKLEVTANTKLSEAILANDKRAAFKIAKRLVTQPVKEGGIFLLNGAFTACCAAGVLFGIAMTLRSGYLAFTALPDHPENGFYLLPTILSPFFAFAMDLNRSLFGSEAKESFYRLKDKTSYSYNDFLEAGKTLRTITARPKLKLREHNL
ncbi:MAG: hypothetical protein PHE27_07090 [Alphaproteobacteria bacterium]|nr:hypothetical protein [Alphaproteobacteria bacterium]